MFLYLVDAPLRRYQSLRRTFESRLASLADSVGLAVGDAVQDEVVLQLSASANTRDFAPGHARSLIKRQLVAERSTYFHGLALKLAAAEAEASRCSRRAKELSKSVAVLREEAVRGERSRIKANQVNAEIQDLRREYQVRRYACALQNEARVRDTLFTSA